MQQKVPIASPEHSLSEIVSRLALVQKSSRGAPAYARWVNRRFGRLLAAIAFKRSLTPNQVTVTSAVLTFAAIVLIAALRPTSAAGFLIAALLVLGFALDAADGQLARLRGGGSAAGEWLDHVIDCMKCSALHLAVLISWYRFFDLPSSFLFIPLVFTFQSAVFFFTIILTEQLRRSASGILPSRQPRTREAAPILRSLIVVPADYGLMCLSFALLGAPVVFVWVYTALMLANVIFLIGALPRWYREMRSIS